MVYLGSGDTRLGQSAVGRAGSQRTNMAPLRPSVRKPFSDRVVGMVLGRRNLPPLSPSSFPKQPYVDTQRSAALVFPLKGLDEARFRI